MRPGPGAGAGRRAFTPGRGAVRSRRAGRPAFAPGRGAVRSRRAGRPAFAPGRGAVRLRSGRGGPGRAALLSESAYESIVSGQSPAGEKRMGVEKADG